MPPHEKCKCKLLRTEKLKCKLLAPPWTWMDRGNTICPFHHSSNGRGIKSEKNIFTKDLAFDL